MEDEQMMMMMMMKKKMGSVGDALMKLQESLQMAHRKLEYADENMIVVEPTWFDDLRDVSNDVKAIMDESFKHIDIMATLSSQVHWYSPFTYVYHNLYFPQQISHRIKSIDSKLKDILKQKLECGSTLSEVDTTIEHGTNTLVGEIERDAEKLVEKLLAHDSYGFYVYGIVGERGTGKTILAKRIFNHKRIRDTFQFPPPIWVHVHKNSTHVTIMKSIIDQIGGDSSKANSNWFELGSILSDIVTDKNIFVVLDDVRESNNLKAMLHLTISGDRNIKVLITSRYESVITSINCGIYKHKLRLLSQQDGWALMCKLLFRDDSEKGNNMQLLEEIGKKMVNKCHGLPLSIKTIVRILNSKKKIPDEWEKVLENIIVLVEPSEKLPETVYLVPYENLSPYIKQCFIFCAFFPKDYIFEKSILIQQWVAAGLVNESSISIEEKKEKTQHLEDVANDYYMELLESNILQPTECLYYYDDDDDDQAKCRLPRNLRSFGRHLVENGYFQGDLEALGQVIPSAPKLRHLVITDHASLDAFSNIVKIQTSLQTLIFISKLEITKLPKDLFQKSKFLRILDISGSDCRVLPRSLFKLMHLRYLNLSCLPIKSLPEEVGDLINLQCLILRYCGSLLSLPDSITRLQKLRSIDLHQTPLNGMPIGISKLSQLTSLIGSVASYTSLKEISLLRELRTLSIVSNVLPYSQIFQDHIHLTDLTLSCWEEGQQYEEHEMKNMREAFDKLWPPDTIQLIKINGYFGEEFPTWISKYVYITSFRDLRRLDLLNCKYCKELPPLGLLPSLEHVRIKDAWSIEHIGSEFIGEGGSFPKLRSLILQDMPQWTEWWWERYQYGTVMTVLESLEIINCPKLKSLPEGLAYYAKSLATLTVYKAHSLEKVEGFRSVKTAMFFSNHNLSTVSGFPVSPNLEIDDCPKLQVPCR